MKERLNEATFKEAENWYDSLPEVKPEEMTEIEDTIVLALAAKKLGRRLSDEDRVYGREVIRTLRALKGYPLIDVKSNTVK